MRPAWRCPPRCKAAAWSPVLKGETPADWRKAFYYHYYEYPTPHHVRPHYGVVTDSLQAGAISTAPTPTIGSCSICKTDPREMTSAVRPA